MENLYFHIFLDFTPPSNGISTVLNLVLGRKNQRKVEPLALSRAAWPELRALVVKPGLDRRWGLLSTYC